MGFSLHYKYTPSSLLGAECTLKSSVADPDPDPPSLANSLSFCCLSEICDESEHYLSNINGSASSTN
jgi:hypothetical protein